MHCKEIIRLGNIKDGGWEVCNDIRFRPRHPCLVYSFGYVICIYDILSSLLYEHIVCSLSLRFKFASKMPKIKK